MDAITVSTDAYRRRLEERYSQARGKTEVIPPGIDIEYFKPATVMEHERKSIFFLSVLDEFHRYKGLGCLLEAVKGLDVELTVGGGGRLLDEYRKKAGDNVRFLGRISEEEKIRLYQSSDLFVLPSISEEQEGFGIVALEALACGTPCIVSNIVGLSNRIREKRCGTVVPPRDIDALRSAIDEFEPDEASRKRARDLSLEYSWSKIAERFERVYQRIMG
jgi:glycosyltransferase involved in cell wall biosynthesis